MRRATARQDVTRPDGRRGRAYGFLTRAGAVCVLGASVLYGLMQGGHLDDPRTPLYGLSGKFAGYFGYAADDIEISGLQHQQPETVLKAIGVRPGGQLFGFDTKRSKKLLENIDWVESAHLRRVHPNRLEIEIAERAPFAVWQRSGARYVIDRTGVALSSLSPADFPDLLLVTGEGAQNAVSELVNHMEGREGLISRLRAAARVGDRRWTLYLDGGARVALASDIKASLDRLMDLAKRELVFDRDVEIVDLRLPNQVIVRLRRGSEQAITAELNEDSQ